MLEFPIGNKACWQNRVQTSEKLESWLYDDSSLTKKLKNLCTEFELVLLGQDTFSKAELPQFSSDTENSEDSLIREVILYCDNKPWVYAHTQIPKRTLEHGNQFLSELGHQPLGEALFSQPNMKRDNIQVAKFASHSPVYRFVENNLAISFNHDLFGRRSQFSLDSFPLVVTEVFLPDSFLYHV
ncbi:chorismate--pyruvate lyase family protein [Catenovulum maritimum]|uniref:Probable chorismate pyruvate-lyase n=1 Tax=Catenovulum maritimum TaxID=1513271 RepID=A0A0J8JND6_9ALTE|nr:chorismate lyase [Catenovulum maritimum]KMT66121.1 hypothetical protein XM47_04920 [Catenovulum maritimum]